MKLGKLCILFTDGDWIESKDQSDSGIRLIQTGNIGNGEFLYKNDKAKYISVDTFKRLNCKEVFPNDILVSRLPEPVGRGCIIPDIGEKMITAVDCTICRINENLVDRKYFCYFLESNAYKTQLEQHVTGTTRKRISRKNLSSIEIDIPEQAKQKEVVYKLDRLKKIIQNYNRELDLLDELIKARVSYHSYETKMKFLEEGIHYDELSDEEKKEFEEHFSNTDTITSSEMNKFVFNINTIDTVIRDLMEHGIKIEGGDKIGKSIIFAANQNHANKIKERFDILYPEYKGKIAEVITFNTKYVQNAIDRFSKTDSYPQIAISVDMLDTGIDVPDIVNLVFFKKVRSKAKFWQMIGRGTRLRTDLFGPGDDKKGFLIFDYLGNMDYFRVDQRPEKSGIIESLSQRIYKLRVDILYALEQNASDQDYVDEINKQIKEMSGYIQSLNEDSFNVKMHLKYVHQYKNPDNWINLNEMDTHYIKDELSSLVVIHDEDKRAKFFDRQMYMIEMAYLNHYDASQVINKVIMMADELYKKQTTPDIADNAEYLKCAKDPDYWKTANYFDLEVLREKIRGLIKYLTIDGPVNPVDTHFEDEIIETKMNDAFYNDEGLENYKEKVQHYLKAHEDDEAIYKLRHNQVITPDEMKHLENLLWIDLGSKDDYRLHFGDTPITRLIRKIVGLDRQAAMAEFSRFLDDQSLNSRQIHFVELLVDYIVKNGFIEDKKVLLQDPFKSIGSMSALFKDKMNIAREILKTVDTFSERC